MILVDFEVLTSVFLSEWIYLTHLLNPCKRFENFASDFVSFFVKCSEVCSGSSWLTALYKRYKHINFNNFTISYRFIKNRSFDHFLLYLDKVKANIIRNWSWKGLEKLREFCHCWFYRARSRKDVIQLKLKLKKNLKQPKICFTCRCDI